MQDVRIDDRRGAELSKIDGVSSRGGAQIAASRRSILQPGIEQIAVDDVVPVGVGPAASRDRPHHGETRVRRGVRWIVRRVGEVATPVELDGRLAVSGNVVRDTDTWREV